jgi:HAD superfamily hydrolase (TIGR01490 family)
MNLAIFDLDHTLIPLDSDYQWTRFFIAHCDPQEQAHLTTQNDALMAAYNAGTLDPDESLRFLIGLLARQPRAVLETWRQEFIATCVLPSINTAARQLVDAHRQAGDRLVIATSTNRFVTEPIAQAFGVATLVATEPEVQADGRFTGQWLGTASFREGKVARVQQCLAAEGLRLDAFERSYFYSDSINDVPLLECVTDPVATNPSPALEAVALERGWKIIRIFSDQEVL